MEEKNIWRGKIVKPIYGPQDSLGAVIIKALQKNPDQVAQACYTSGRELTNREILSLSIRVAQHLEDLNIEQTEVVGICAANSDYLAPLVFGCIYRGLVISTLDPSFDKDGIRHIYSITKPKLMFCDGSIYYKVKEVFDDCGLSSTVIYTVKDHIDGVPNLNDFLAATQREHEFKSVDLKMGSDQLFAIMCSSGTTGLPKGVCITHVAILNQLLEMPLNCNSYLCFSSLYWMSGVFALLIGTISNLTRIITENPYTPESFIEIVKRYKPEIFFGPPSQLGMLLGCAELQQNDLTSLKYIVIGGSAVPFSMVEKSRNYFPVGDIVVGYGQTEICGGVSTGPAIEDGCCGQLNSNIEVKIIDDNNKSLGPGEVGEICARSLYPWPGYYCNAEATANTYDSESWIHTGDLGYINEKGDLYVIDRKKDILKYNNFHFYPSEIEAVIQQLPDVVEVCVFGLPDLIYTYLPAAAIVKKPGSMLDANAVYEYVAEKMAHFKHLRGGVYFLDQMPTTASGKILRRNMVDMCKKLIKQ